MLDYRSTSKRKHRGRKKTSTVSASDASLLSMIAENVDLDHGDTSNTYYDSDACSDVRSEAFSDVYTFRQPSYQDPAPSNHKESQSPAYITIHSDYEESAHHADDSENTEDVITVRKLQGGRRAITPDSLLTYIDDIMTKINGKMGLLRDLNVKYSDLRMFRDINRDLRMLRKRATKLFAKIAKNKQKRRENARNGLNKRYTISTELAKFTGWPEDAYKSRVDVTRFIVQYVKTNRLHGQDKGERHVIHPDVKLRRLFSDFTATASASLTYASMQKYITKHLIEPEKEVHA